MDPTAREYFHNLETIREELRLFKAEQGKLRLQISDLFEENKRLTNELKENVELRFLQQSDSDRSQLEQKLQAAVSSKNAAIEMWQAALQQLEKQEELLVGKKSIVAAERSELEKQFLQMKEGYTKGLNVLSEELAHSRDELSALKKELEVKNSELENCNADLISARKELELSKKTNSELSEANNQLADKNDSFQSSLAESDKALEKCKEALSSLTAKNAELSASVSKLEEQNKKLKSEIQVYERDAKDSLLAAEQAVLQKQEIMCKEEQYLNEIKRLKSSIDVENEKVSMRFEAELKDIKKKAAEKIQELMSEIDHLHKEIGERQNLFERANREKQALESKVEQLFSESSNGVPFSNSAFEDICNRLTTAERAKNELELKVLSLENALLDLKSSKEQETQHYLEKQNNLVNRLSSLSKDFSQASSDRVKFSDEVRKLKKKSSDQEKELTELRRKYSTSISTLEAESRRKQHALQEQLRSTEEHYKTICTELQELLDAEFKISNKWKAEIEDLMSKSEKALRELSQENVQLKSNMTELMNILHQNNMRIPNDILISLS